jgi:septal ring factor EnvC (AmiA/AmiB activator)
MIRPLALALLLLAGPAGAQDLPAAAAEAARRLEEAAGLLRQSGSAEDRLAALTRTVRAHEEGLALMRDALRRVAEERARIEADLSGDRETTARLLGALQSMGAAPEASLLLHPDGALATARAGMMLADAAPALEAGATELRDRLEALREAEAAQEQGLARLREGLASVQEARAELAAAAANRTELPRAYSEDPVATALLMASMTTLQDFAAGLDQTVAERLGDGPDASAEKGALALPVTGAILRRPGEPDAAGVTRPGVAIATEPRALVTVPVASTLRFRGPLLDYGTVAILEPAPGTLIVLAGLAQVWGEAGEILPAGAPLGLMGGEAPAAEAALAEAPPPETLAGEGGATEAGSTRAPVAGEVGEDAPTGDAMVTEPAAGGSGGRTETLYLEVREAGGPVDPGTWFRLD